MGVRAMTGWLTRAFRGLLAGGVLMALIGTPAARAQDEGPVQQIVGLGPLTDIVVGDEFGCQIADSADSSFEFAPDGGFPADCGTLLAIGNGPGSQLYGPNFQLHLPPGDTQTGLSAGSGNYNAFTPVSQTGGFGTTTSSNQITTTADAGQTGISVIEVDSYVPGDDYYTTTVTVDNGSDAPLNGKLYHPADCFVRSFTASYGELDTGGLNGPAGDGPAPACTVNENNSPASAIAELIPVGQSPGVSAPRYAEEQVGSGAGQIWGDIGAQQDLADACEPDCTTPMSRAIAIEWDIDGLAPQASDTFQFETKVDDPLITAIGGFVPAGSAPERFSGTVARIADSDLNTTPADYAASVDWGDGSSPDHTATISGAGGSFTVQDTHTYARNGLYSVMVMITYAGNPDNLARVDDVADIGVAPPVPDPGPITGHPSITMTRPSSPPPPPVLGKSVDVSVISGQVFFELPAPAAGVHKTGRATASAAAAAASTAHGFRRLTAASRIPTGSVIDSMHGKLAIVAASPARHQTYNATLSGGVYRVSQASSGRQKGLTTLKLVYGVFPHGPTFAVCTPRRGLAGAAGLSNSILQTLNSSAHGRFRTSGRYGAAAVRGTSWSISDRCDGTLIHAIVHAVVVQDFVRHITFLLHAGHSYLARAP